MTFDWREPLGIELQLSAEERFDGEILHELGELGLLGIGLEGEGCPGGSHVMYGLVAREIERVDLAYRSVLSVQSSLVMFPILSYASPELKRRWLPALGKGGAVGAFGLTEPDHGSDPGEMSTRARRQGGDWLINGVKSWISHAPVADVFVVWARDEDDVLRGFVLERGVDPRIEGKLSLRASVTGRIALADVLPGRARLSRAFQLPQQGALRHLPGSAGRCRNLLVCGPWLCAGPQAVRPAARSQPVDPEEAGRHAGGHRARAEGLLAAGPDVRCRRGEPRSRVVAQAQQLPAGAGCRPHRARHARRQWHQRRLSGDAAPVLNLETVNTYEGTEDIHAPILGRGQTGLSAF